MKIIGLILFLAANSVWASDPGMSRCESEQDIAEEVVRAELSGRRLPGPASACLEQDKFKHIRVNNYGINAVLDAHPKVIDHNLPIKVRVFRTSPQNNPLKLKEDRRADFSQIVNGREVKLGTLYFNLRHLEDPLHATQGCAVAWAFPSKIHVFDNCLQSK